MNKETKYLRELETKYLRAKIAYYDPTPENAKDLLSDPEFDALENFLKEKGSKVVEQVGSKRRDFDFPHPTKMLSLDKIQTERTKEGTNYMTETFQKWLEKRTSIVGKTSLLYSPKFDGNGINIIYKGTSLYLVLTRGDSFAGKDITEKFRLYFPETLTIPSLSIDENTIIEIRCEAVIKKSVFNKKYSEFANPRNFVAGKIGRDETDREILDDLDIFPLHYIVDGKHVDQENFNKNSFFAESYEKEFEVSNYENLIKTMEDYRESVDYLLDGVVISFPPQLREKLGENDHDPEWAISIKFVPEEAITKVNDIEWKVSKSGTIIPTILLKPIQLAGTEVKRASGYNAGYIVKKKIGPETIVSISKAGDIIPEIQKIIVSSEKSFKLIENCPVCNSKLTFDGVHLSCPNSFCLGKIARKLTCGAKVVKLKRVGKKTLEHFAKDFENFYELFKWVKEEGASQKIEKYGIKYNSRSHEIFLGAFNSIKSLSYDQVIEMMAYESVGAKIAKQVAKEFCGLEPDYKGLEKALIEKLRENKAYIENAVKTLKNLGIKIDKQNNNVIYICMTGSPKEFGFKTKEEFIKQFPNLEEVSITDKNCNYLITDSYSSTSNKMKIATKKDIIIKTYGDFKI